MADFGKILKATLDTSVQAARKAVAVTGKAIGKAATASGKAISHAATTTMDMTRFKMDEMGTIRRRNEVIAELGAKMYELFLAGTDLPAEAAEIAAKVQAVDAELENLRSEFKARKEAAAKANTAEVENAAVEEAPETATEAPVLEVEAEVETEPEEQPAVDEAEKVPTINVPVED